MLSHADKLRFLTAGADLGLAEGLEIGPRDAPLACKPACNVLYADYARSETIKANLGDTAIDPGRVCDVDIVTAGGKLSEATPRRFDYVLASHVAEHVPDLLGWLLDLGTVLRPGGTIGLAVPDRRFTFDRTRAESTVAEAVEAWILGYRRPSIRQLVDSAWQSVEMSPAQGWTGDVPSRAALLRRHDRLPNLLRWVRDVHESGRYADAHCWVFTPLSFLTLLQQFDVLGLFPFVLERFQPTQVGGYEFLVVLRGAQPRQASEVTASIACAMADLAVHAGEAEFAANHVARETVAARAQAAALLDELTAMRSSRSWRTTSPFRRLKRLLVRLRPS